MVPQSHVNAIGVLDSLLGTKKDLLKNHWPRDS